MKREAMIKGISRRASWVALICVVGLLVYGASPYVSFWRFTVALRSGDTAALNAHVDFPAVRKSLKAQLVAYFSPEKTGEKHIKNKRLAGLVTALRPTLIDALVAAYVTPDGL